MIKCKFENKGEASLRHVTVDGIIYDNGRILLNKRGKYKGEDMLEAGKWSIIGGFVERRARNRFFGHANYLSCSELCA